MTNLNNTTLYIGVTSNLQYRVWQHKNRFYQKSFTTRYNLTKLVYYECFLSIEDAIIREKQLKGGSRARKIDLINSMNAEWNDLYQEEDD
jgi:putative endonuclease